MSHDQSNGAVAHVLITPRVFEREMTAEEHMTVDRLVREFHELMRGQRLVVAAQAIGMLTGDYCEQVMARGGDTVCALQDIASRGQDWVSAGDAAKIVVEKARRKMLPPRRVKRKVT